MAICEQLVYNIYMYTPVKTSVAYKWDCIDFEVGSDLETNPQTLASRWRRMKAGT